ncbi:ATP-binding cassette domain-containing protein [Carnobacteriaceae bacterium zg-ZUI78]|uniref:energy-coupling factor ABC transporter ATP-binding protein n=1 Tax=Granulicatella sp. zg-84 TaxID=2678503 RepID=UPI0013C2743D|nr:ATP-binding cassette domain-containing protein [Granulicatella sp. zg-84]MBS4749704.1 ATP-binding cassette domain-containing protein [Carnobacteriaceae bacterium zg-ZUI78]NEW65907.1 ATP-binding cassette domain-containing protein [Granulicatella sp. zg-84]QMI85136.1 ATP-binding cassette domain-containing protein [Carnobacteriaceae bacterium zg-84]
MLQLNDVTFAYDKVPTIHHVSMAFQEGKITGILGMNGSGKSTIMKLIMGLLKAESGEIIFDNQPITINKKALYDYRQKVNMVFQNPEQQIFYTIVKEDIAMALKNLGYDKHVIDERVSKVLDIMDITHLQDKPVQYLSYGQKKRVAIAGMLALQPRFLLLDEPTAGLDPKGRDKMNETMQRLVQAGTSIILSSHDMDLMYDCCDYAYVIKKGSVLTQGEKYQVFQEATLLKEAGLSVPWIVKLHQTIGTPLAKNEALFFEHFAQK